MSLPRISAQHKERLPAELEMSWANYLIPVVTSSALMFSCWLVGHYQFSLLWIFLFVGLYVLKTRTWIRREQKRISLRNMILRERETVMAQYSHRDDLPAWVQFPDIERIEWVNKIIQQLWPYIGEYTKIFLHEFIEPQIRAQMPSPFKSFKFVSVDMGDIPFRVGGLKVYTQNVGRDKVIMDMDVVYAGDAEFVVQACGFRGGLNQLVLTGKLRTILQPLLPHPPMVGGVAGAFIELPKFDFNLTGMGEFVQLPGLIDAIRSVMNAQMANLAVLPNKIVVPLAPHIDVSRLYFPEPDGVIRLKLIEAMNLENKDWNFIKKDISDPYCEVQVGSQIFRTKVINNNLNPIFNECFEAIVDQASGQKLRIELFDKDTAGADEELGRLAIPLDMVRQTGEIEKWYHLEGCKHGELRLKICWLNLSANVANSNREDHQWENEWMAGDKQMHSALLMVYIDSITNLPYPKSNLEPSPFVELSMGRITQRSPVKPKTVNPLFQSKFNFFVKNPEGQQEELRIRAIDEGTRKEIGELLIPLGNVLREPGLEFNQHTFYLQHGVHSSPIVLTIRLRYFTRPKNLLENHEKTYGTAAHIERGGSNLGAADSTGTMMKNGEAETTCPEAGKIVSNNNEEKNVPELQLYAHNTLGLHQRTTRRPSTTNSEHTISSSRSSKKSKAEVFLDKLIGVKHTKMRKPRRSILPSTAGKIQIGLNYDQQRHKLVATIIAVTDLQPIEKEGHADPFVTVKLVPNSNGGHSTNTTKSRRRHTQIVRNSLNPIFDEEFEFDVPFTELHNYKLQLAVKDSINYGLFSIKQPTLGTAEIPNLSLDSMKTQWLDLITPQK